MSGPVKCLVWDLDNTLWTGTLLEGGAEALAEPVREVLATLDERGILHSIASKNHHDLAWERLEALGVAGYFVLPQIGWGAKSASIRHLAERLNFAHTAFAFVDDQPAERAEVAFHLPEVRCYGHDRLAALPALPEFTPPVVTADSRRRRQTYQANFRREAEREAFPGPDEAFLRTLGLELRVTPADPGELARVEELTLRTSQMNATGVPYSDAALRELCADPRHEVLVAALTDRFGPHGAIGVLLLEKRPGCWHLKLLATSCRVVSFGIGGALLAWVTDQAARAGAHLAADFRATGRNRMMEIAYRFAGFTEDPCPCLPEPHDGDVQRLHLVPERRPLPDTLRVIAPDLTAAR